MTTTAAPTFTTTDNTEMMQLAPSQLSKGSLNSLEKDYYYEEEDEESTTLVSPDIMKSHPIRHWKTSKNKFVVEDVELLVVEKC